LRDEVMSMVHRGWGFIKTSIAPCVGKMPLHRHGTRAEEQTELHCNIVSVLVSAGHPSIRGEGSIIKFASKAVGSIPSTRKQRKQKNAVDPRVRYR
jgi:hypothetical protein